MASCSVNWVGTYSGSEWDGWLSSASSNVVCIHFTTPSGSFNKLNLSIQDHNTLYSGTMYPDAYLTTYNYNLSSMSKHPGSYIGEISWSRGGSSYKTFTTSLSGNTEYIMVIDVGSYASITIKTSSISISVSTEYTIYYEYNDGKSGSTSQDITSSSHTIISTIPTYSGDYDNTTNFTITGYANGGDGGDRSVTASKRTWSTHTFLGWSKTNGATTASYTAGNTISVSGDTWLYGVWSSSSGTTYSNNTLEALGSTTWSSSSTGCTVTLNVNGGNALSASTLNSGKTTNHTFLGWNTNSGSSSALASTTAYTSNTSVYAIWDTKITDNSTVTLPTPTRSNDTSYHTVTLNGNGGTTTTKSIQTEIITSYSFKGWATSSSASSGITGSYTPTSDVTLYAIWSANSPTYPSVTLPTDGLSKSSSSTMYTTTLNLNGGTHTQSSVTTGYTNYYTFSHWSSTTSGSSVGTSISGTTYSTLYAIWKISSTSYTTKNLGNPSKSIYYRVTFDASGGTVSPAYKNISGSYIFSGWYDSSGNKITNSSSYRATSNNTLTARWSSSPTLTGISLPTPTRSAVDGTFTITLNANGGSLSSSITNPITAYSNTSFAFKGWATTAGDSNTIVSNTNYAKGSNHTLYAIWTSDTDIDGIALPTSGVTKNNYIVTTYKITLDPVDGSVDPLSINTNKVRRYVFKGWSPTGNTTDMVSLTNYIATADIVLKAAYAHTDSVNPIDLPDATKTDHTFLGWTTVEGATNYVATRYTTSNNITLYANYLANYRGSLWIWYNGKWNKCVANLFTGDRFNGAI